MTEPAKKPEPVSDDQLLRQIQGATATIEVAERNKKAASAELLARRKEEVAKLLKEKPEPYGKVEITVGNHQVDVTTPKKVDWDQKILKQKVKEVVDSGNDPALYVKTEYSISEERYKSFPEDVREWFSDARIVKTGSVSMKIVEEKE